MSALDALAFARSAAIELTSLKYNASDKRFRIDLPPELQKDRVFTLIFRLPQIFAEQKKLFAAHMAELWQFGSSAMLSGVPSTLVSDPDYQNPVFRIPSQALIERGKIVKWAVAEAYHDIRRMLDQARSNKGVRGRIWEKLAVEIKRNPLGKEDAWTRGYGIEAPYANGPLFVSVLQIDSADYIALKEFPTSSDVFGGIGSFGVRMYISVVLEKKKDVEEVIVQLRSMAVRIYDSYDFSDKYNSAGNIASAIAGAMMGGQFSQYLGAWTSSEDGARVVLQNADFDRYRREFQPKYNEWIDKSTINRKKLNCTDFNLLSEFTSNDLDVPPLILKKTDL